MQSFSSSRHSSIDPNTSRNEYETPVAVNGNNNTRRINNIEVNNFYSPTSQQGNSSNSSARPQSSTSQTSSQYAIHGAPSRPTRPVTRNSQRNSRQNSSRSHASTTESNLSHNNSIRSFLMGGHNSVEARLSPVAFQTPPLIMDRTPAAIANPNESFVTPVNNSQMITPNFDPIVFPNNQPPDAPIKRNARYRGKYRQQQNKRNSAKNKADTSIQSFTSDDEDFNRQPNMDENQQGTNEIIFSPDESISPTTDSSLQHDRLISRLLDENEKMMSADYCAKKEESSILGEMVCDFKHDVHMLKYSRWQLPNFKI